ncbi:MAG: hypothetical protein GY799_20540 [Desulfobulbaceae bacterium]|nr:hypothetical protein [Desulfobulbaceae bacterium]
MKEAKFLIKPLTKNFATSVLFSLGHEGASFKESIGVPISHIQEILGHENRSTTEGYIHTLGNNKVKTIERFEKAGLQSCS